MGGVCNGHHRAHLAEPRPPDALLAMLAERLEWFLRQSPARQVAIDSERFLPTKDTHRLLAHFCTHGHFSDETAYGRPLGHKAAAA